jgi:hypothetical protein
MSRPEGCCPGHATLSDRRHSPASGASLWLGPFSSHATPFLAILIRSLLEFAIVHYLHTAHSPSCSIVGYWHLVPRRCPGYTNLSYLQTHHRCPPNPAHCGQPNRRARQARTTRSAIANPLPVIRTSTTTADSIATMTLSITRLSSRVACRCSSLRATTTTFTTNRHSALARQLVSQQRYGMA